jgi:hypothetical protein
LIEIKPPGRRARSVVAMELLSSIAVAGATLLGLLIVGCIVITLVKAGAGESPEVLLERALRRQGPQVAHLALATGDAAFGHAIRQCTRCTESPQCRAWLSSGARDGYQSFCPNAGFIRRMKLLAD